MPARLQDFAIVLALTLSWGCLMFLPRQTVTQPVGLVTQPNQYGQYPAGASRIARNLTLRRPGEMVQAPDATGRVTPPFAGVNNSLRELFALDGGHVYSWGLSSTGWSVCENANTAAVPAALALGTSLWAATRITPFRLAERMLANSQGGVLVGDFMQPATAPQRALRFAGLTQPIMTDPVLLSGTDGVIPAGTMIGYRGVWRRKVTTAYELVSVPSPIFKVFLTGGGNYNTQWTVRQPIAPLDLDSVQVGDIFELYRTNGIPAASITTDPGDDLKLVAAHIWTAADAAAGFATVVDAQSFSPFGSTVTPGRALYTNPTQEGENEANDQPPIAQCAATFKGYAFYANTTDRPSWSFSVQGGFGLQAVAITAGAPSAYFKRFAIGSRTGLGVIVGGNATVTGVSAADMVGIVVGQRWGGSAQWTSANRVIAIGATSFTMNVPASGSGSPTVWEINDVIEIDGVEVVVRDYKDIVFGSAALRKYEITSSVAVGQSEYTIGADVTIEPLRFNGGPLATMTVRATNGASYTPPVPELTAAVQVFGAETLPNHYGWSKEQQGEHAPRAHEGFAGSGEVITLIPTRDALWFWCTDGLYRLSGEGGVWRLDLVNTTLILAAPGASDAMNEVVYGYTNEGFVGVDSAGTKTNLTDRVIGDLLPGERYEATRNIIVCRNETDHEMLLVTEDAGSSYSRTIHLYNTSEKGWTQLANNQGLSDLGLVSALAYQRQPNSGAGRVLFGGAADAPGFNTIMYCAWGGNDLGAYLTAAHQYQPFYGADPLTMKQWVWADYLFSENDNGRTLVPTFNGQAFTQPIDIELLDMGSYGRAFIPRYASLAHSMSPGFEQLVDNGVQARFQGISIAVKEFGNQSKKR